MRMNEVFKALADPPRRAVLKLLRGGERTAGQLADRFSISKPSMSHHFNALKAADLIGSRKEGQQVIYFLNTTAIQDFLAVMLDLFSGGGGTDGKDRAP